MVRGGAPARSSPPWRRLMTAAAPEEEGFALGQSGVEVGEAA